MKQYKIIIVTILLVVLQIGCKKDFLDQRPDLSKVTPQTLMDCNALLDDYSRMNAGYPDHGEAAADNYYLIDAVYNSLPDVNNSPENRYNYSWHRQGEHVTQWIRGYQIIYNANLVLSTLEKISPYEPNYNVIKGSALFYRAFAFYHLAQLFCKPYISNTAETDLGIPLRLTPDPNEISTRGTVQKVYDQIIIDLKQAISLLPMEVQIKSRPSKAAAYGALARAYLSMEDYINAGKMASECLKLQNTLIDYNMTTSAPSATTVRSGTTGASFIRFNAEVIFQSVTISGTLTQSRTFIHPDLYSSYSTDDRRKTVFFQTSGGNVLYRGNYDGTVNPVLFMGLATDELYLIRAECHARSGKTLLAMQDLNTLMAKRMEHPYINRTASDAADALKQILTERRKELIFRTLRWTDLRRLNKDPRFAITLRRDRNNIGETPLQPNDLRYTFLIPTREVINLTGMPQNPR